MRPAQIIKRDLQQLIFRGELQRSTPMLNETATSLPPKSEHRVRSKQQTTFLQLT